MSNKVLRVTMPDYSEWEIPMEAIAALYETDEDRTRGENPSVFDLIDWAENNLNWTDICEHATKASNGVNIVDYQDGWVNGKKTTRKAKQ